MTAAFTRLAAALDGTLARPGEAAHDAARLPLVRDAEQRPAAVARCASVRDVATAIRFAADTALPFAVRGGGHSFADRSSTTGLLVDLGALDTLVTDPDTGTVTVGPGVRVAALDRAMAARDLVVPVGWCPTVGVVGAALGGGFGPFGRLRGLACDHIVAADVVLADGRSVRVDRDREPDLWWALRGAGGGQFGVVTALELGTHPASSAVAFDLTWSAEHAEAVLAAWQHWALHAPDTLNAELVLAAGRDPNTTALAVVFGLSAHTEPDLTPFLRRVGVAPLRSRQSARAPTDHSYAGVAFDPPPLPPPGTPAGTRVVRSEYFDSPLPPEAIGALVDNLRHARVPGQYREIEFIPWRGAYARPADSAFSHRIPLFLVEHNADTTTGSGDHVAAWVRRSWSVLHRWGTGAVYPNYPDPDLTDWARAYHGPSLDRLVGVKRAYDPQDLFTSSQSLASLAGTGTPTDIARTGRWAPH
jgi:FAD/FMN-containing dehydrogenase